MVEIPISAPSPSSPPSENREDALTMTTAEWLTLTYATGVGGSILIIGSAAGIIAMSKVKELTFGTYFKMAGYLLGCYSLGYVGVYFVGQTFLS